MKRIISTIFALVLLASMFVPQYAVADKTDEYNFLIGVPQVVDNNVEVTYTGKSWVDENGNDKWEYKAKIHQAPIYNDDGSLVNCGFSYISPQPIYDGYDEDEKVDSYTQGYFEVRNNVFYAKVEGTKVTVTYQGETSTYDPVVYIGSTGHTAKSVTLVAVDPTNSFYRNNILEWDYGVCIRRIRVIEGLIQETFIFDKDPKGTVWIKDNAQQTSGYEWSIEPYAYDADGNNVPVNEYKQVSAKDMESAVYPVTIDPTDQFVTSASDGHLAAFGQPFNTVWTAVSANSISNTGACFYIGMYESPSLYRWYLHRGCVFFDTSAIPDSATISAANVSLYGFTDTSTTDFNISISNGMSTYPHDPLEVGDYSKTHYTGLGSAGYSTAGFTTAGYNNISLNASGIGWIDISGTTKFYVISYEDYIGSDCGASGSEYVAVWAYEKGAGYRPYLEVTYSSARAPTVTTNPATYITTTGVRFNGSLDADGGEACNVSFQYIPWYNTSWSDVFAVTVDPTYVDSTLTGFPVLVTGDDAPDSFWTTVNASGLDIVVTDGNLTKLSRELVSINTSAETMELYFNASSIDDTVETHFYVWYGGVAAESNDTATWDESFVGVWHMNDLNTSAISDSTVNDFTGTKKGANEPIESTGSFGGDKSQDLDGVDDFMTMGDVCEFDYTDTFTLSAVVNFNETSGNSIVGKIKSSSSYIGYDLFTYTGDGLRLGVIYDYSPQTLEQRSADSRITAGSWMHVAGAYDGTNNASDADVYINGLNANDSQLNNTINNSILNDYALTIGARNAGGSNELNGSITEVRISDTNRSASWEKATYTSLVLPTTFYGVDDTDAYSTTANQSKNTGESWYNDETGLTINTDYGVRAVATNSLGETLGDWVLFDTIVTLMPPTNVSCSAGSNSITLSWVKGGNTSNTYIRYKTGGYPTGTSDGNIIILQSGVDYVHTGLTSGVSYFYKMWGEAGGVYSATNTTIMCTTTAGYSTATPVPLPTVDTSDWSDTPNGSVLENNPLYGLGNQEADAIGVPHTTWWMLLALGGLVVLGLFIYTRTRDTVATIAAIIIFGVIMAQAGFFPIWTMMIFGLVGIGFGWKGLR